jgi:hypothetical protein
MAAACSNLVFGRLLAPAALHCARRANLPRLQVPAARAPFHLRVAALKASPKGEGFNPPSVGQ